MTSRILLSKRVSSTLLLLATLAVSSIPNTAAAQTEINTRQTPEIKITQFNIPTVRAISIYLNKDVDQSQIVTVEIQPTQQAPVIESPEATKPAPVKQAVKPVSKISYNLPAKSTPENRVYMHEPEILAYICPKMGEKNCKTFMAVLKAENGTHECTRDNRGLNRNGSVDIGLAQINWKPGNPWHTFEQLQDCKYNLDVALEMYQRRGFQPWYAYTKGAYKKFLN